MAIAIPSPFHLGESKSWPIIFDCGGPPECIGDAAHILAGFLTSRVIRRGNLIIGMAAIMIFIGFEISEIVGTSETSEVSADTLAHQTSIRGGNLIEYAIGLLVGGLL